MPVASSESVMILHHVLEDPERITRCRYARNIRLSSRTRLSGWFNQRRLPSELGDIPPAEFEHNYYAQNRANNKVPNIYSDRRKTPTDSIRSR